MAKFHMQPSDLQALFREVADLSGEARAAYYQAHAIPDELQAEVESLIQFDETTGTAGTLSGVVSRAAAEWSAGEMPESCGPYRLIRLLAQGGMGAVYLGERSDGELNLQVAVKLIHSAIAGTRDFESRFLKERQILAGLSHPGIARLVDAGRTADRGIPYLVMEYVEGVPIDEYCGDSLSLEARLRLFLEVCEAVAYLHRNLVIHRDLKPSNIMVDREGRAKLLDFGIAKILDEAAADAGMTQERMMTPEYASPEQAMGLATTTATDIYSLGAVLRKILQGAEKGHAALAEDVSAIVEMSMRQEPDRRYATADAFAADLRAALESRPVKARADNRLYRLDRFLRRHWITASAVAMTLVSLAAGLVYSNHQRQLAEQRFSQLRALAETVFHFDASLRNVPGTTRAREELVTASLEYLDGLERDAHLDQDPALALEVANGYKLVGHAQGSPRTANLGKLGPARENLEKASRIVARVVSREPRNVRALLLGLELSADLMSIGDYQDSTELVVEQSKVVSDFTLRLKQMGFPQDEQGRLGVLSSLATAGLACSNMQQLTLAAEHLRQAVALAEPMQPSATKVQVLSNMSAVQRRLGELDESLRLVRQAYDVHAHVQYPSERVRMTATYSLLIRLGSVLGEDESVSLGRGSEALKPLLEAFGLAEEWVAKDPNDVSSRDRVVKLSRVLGDILRHTDPAKALDIYDRGIASARAMKNVSGKRDEARLLAKTARPLRRLGRADEAGRRMDEAFAILRELGMYPPAPGSFAPEMDGVVRCQAEHQLETGRAGFARQTYEQWMQWVEERKIAPQNLTEVFDFSRFYLDARRAYVALGMTDEAAKLDDRRRRLWIEWDRRLPGNQFIALRRGE